MFQTLRVKLLCWLGERIPKTRPSHKPTFDLLENRLAPAAISHAAGAFELSRTPGMNTWVEPSTVYTNTVPQNDRLEATIRLTYTFNSTEATQLLTLPLNISHSLWFEEDDSSSDDLVGTSRVAFTVPAAAGGSVTKDLAPASFVTTLARELRDWFEGSTAEYKIQVDSGR